MKTLPSLNFQNSYIGFKGGLDTETPPISMIPGTTSRAQNFEQSVNGGYQTIKGYERYDGRISPSSVEYTTLSVTGIVPSVAVVGGTLTGATSHATGVIIAVTTTHLILTTVTGIFVAEPATVGGSAACVVVDYSSISDAKISAQYKALAANVYRALIQAVPGAGAILGVWYYNGKVYAFRNDATNSYAVMFVATSIGWSPVTLGTEVAFTGGGSVTHVEIPEGTVVTGSVSTKTATVARVVTNSGSWSLGTAAGRLILSGQSGAFQAENLMSGGVVAVIAGNSSQIAFSVPSGRFNFVNSNFGGGTTTERMYGCDGKNHGWEFDGTVIVPIHTGMTNDAPEQVCAHKWHLFFSFFGSMQHSSPGDPYNFTLIMGAAEIGVGSAITGFLPLPGTPVTATLAVFSRNEISVLYGTNSSDWNLTTYKKEIGAFPYSVKLLGNVFFLDERGLTVFIASQVYGGFETSVVTTMVHSWLSAKGASITESCIVRNKNQYRMFFADKSALYLTTENGVVKGSMPVIFPHDVIRMCSSETFAGEEIILFGSSNGFVYQMDRGTSFDGSVIECFIDLSYYNFKTPHISKRYRKLTLEASGNGYSELSVGYSTDYGDVASASAEDSTQILGLTSTFWDDGSYWDAGIFWDGTSILPIPIKMTGSGVNVGIRLRSISDCFESVKISGAQVLYTTSRIIR